MPAIGQANALFRQQAGTFLAAGADLLTMLENQINIPVCALGIQLQRQTAKGRHVAVMAAFMAMARDLGHIGRVDLILYR